MKQVTVYLAFKVTGAQMAEEKNTLGQQDYVFGLFLRFHKSN